MMKNNILERLGKGEVSDEELRKEIRTIWQKRLQWGYKSTHQEQLKANLDFIKSLKKMNISGDMDILNDEFYELPSEFLKIMHGKTIKQSASYFKDESMTLDEAEVASYELYCERAQIEDGQTVLDIGCGHGGLVLYIAQRYPNCHVTGLSNSRAQVNYIDMQCQKLKLTNVQAILADVTKHEFETEINFDRIIVIEAIEHMKNIQVFMKKLSTWMSEESLLFVDYMCHKTFNHHIEAIDEEDWYSDYLFPKGSGTILSSSTLLYFQSDVSVVDHWVMNGNHMARTMQELLKKLDENIETAKSILETAMGGSKEAANQVITHTRTFLLGLYEQCSFNNGEEMMVGHILFKKK